MRSPWPSQTADRRWRVLRGRDADADAEDGDPAVRPRPRVTSAGPPTRGRASDTRRPPRHPPGGRGPAGDAGQPAPRPVSAHPPRPAHAPRPPAEASHTTAPHDELVSVVRGLVESSPKRSVSIDAVANALKSRGFQRSPGSPRLVTRLRRIREILVSPSGTIRLAEDGEVPANGPLAEGEPRREAEPRVEREPMDEVDNDRQPDFLGHPPGEREMPEVDGNRADVDGNRTEPSPGPPGRGRRRRRRRWRSGPRQPASGSPPA